jgi:hypothetical protein
MARVCIATNDLERAYSLIASALHVCRELGDSWAAAAAVDASAALAARRGRLDDAVRLREAGAVLRDNAQITQSPREQTWLEDQLSSTPRRLGTARYASARRAGRAMTLGQSFALALRRDGARDHGSTLLPT